MSLKTLIADFLIRYVYSEETLKAIEDFNKIPHEHLDNIKIYDSGAFEIKDESLLVQSTEFKLAWALNEIQTRMRFKDVEILCNGYETCGCYSCEQFFDRSKIVEWCDNNETPICPKCSIDSVIGFTDTDENNKEVLSELNKKYFQVGYKLSDIMQHKKVTYDLNDIKRIGDD